MLADTRLKRVLVKILEGISIRPALPRRPISEEGERCRGIRVRRLGYLVDKAQFCDPQRIFLVFSDAASMTLLKRKLLSVTASSRTTSFRLTL